MSPLPLSVRFLQTQPDSRLVALARAGHERAFEALVRRYRRQLLSYCRRVGSPSANAEDALQQTFLQAWVALRAGREVRDARAWLFRIAHNVVISSVRQQAGAATLLDRRPAASGADDEAEQRLAVREALAGLASLPGLQRDVMVGAAVDGLSHAEIARELGLTSGAVRGLIYRARSTLRVAAALFIPGSLVHWAVRQGAAPASTGRMYEAIAGGGGAVGLLVKSGVITATAGVLATAAGVVGHHHPRHPARLVVQVVAPGGSGSDGGADHARAAAHRGAAPAATAVEAAAVTRSAGRPAASGQAGRARITIARPTTARPALPSHATSPPRAHRTPPERQSERGGDGHRPGQKDRGDQRGTAPLTGGQDPAYHDGSSSAMDDGGDRAEGRRPAAATRDAAVMP